MAGLENRKIDALSTNLPVLFAQNIEAGYGDAKIVHGVSMEVRDGQIVTLIGPNGAGKSTFLKAIFGILPVTSGRVLLSGKEVTRWSPQHMVKSGVGFVPQTENIFSTLSVKENLEMGVYAAEDDPEVSIEERIEEVLDIFPLLRERLGENASVLSGGQRQTLAMARALAIRPRLLLLDEPTAALSPSVRSTIFSEIKRIRDSSVAVLMVEQNVREALQVSDIGCVLVSGRKIIEMDARGLLKREDIGEFFLRGTLKAE